MRLGPIAEQPLDCLSAEEAQDAALASQQGGVGFANAGSGLDALLILEAMPVGVVAVDGAGTIQLANSVLAAMFGYSREELLGQSVEMLLPKRHRSAHSAQRAAFFGAPQQRSMGSGDSLTGLQKDGVEMPVEIGLTPIQWDGKAMALAAITDLSTDQRRELELRQANQHLEEFTYVASHDLRSPLRAISNLIEWIAEDLGERESETVRHNLSRVHDRIERMERIILDLLNYARAGYAETGLTMVDPAELIAGALEFTPPPDGFDVEVHSAVRPFPAARTPLETVLRNLIGNAFKHHGGDRGKVVVTAGADDFYCLFTISDDGKGVPVPARDRIFRMFQTVSETERKSSGIGLSISKRLIEAHGGHIELAPSEQGKGACFRVWWPRILRKEIHEWR